jgi:hypothetical protein
MYIQSLLAIRVLFVLDFWLYRAALAVNHINQLAIKEISLTLHRSSLLYRGPYKDVLIQNKLDDRFLENTHNSSSRPHTSSTVLPGGVRITGSLILESACCSVRPRPCLCFTLVNHPAENSNPVLFSGSDSRGMVTARLSASLRAIVTTTASIVETRESCARCTHSIECLSKTGKSSLRIFPASYMLQKYQSLPTFRFLVEQRRGGRNGGLPAWTVGSFKRRKWRSRSSFSLLFCSLTMFKGVIPRASRTAHS